MFFKKNEKKVALKKDIRRLKKEIAHLKAIHAEWIKAFMAETDQDSAAAQMTIIKKYAGDISTKEYELMLKKKQYSLV